MSEQSKNRPPPPETPPPVQEPPSDPEPIEGLLSRCKDYLFGTEPEELSEQQLQELVRLAMKKTRTMRPPARRQRLSGGKKPIFFPNHRFLAIAAVICLAVGVFFWAYKDGAPSDEAHGNISGIFGLSPLAQMDVFRSTYPDYPAIPPLFEPDNPPVAYLFRNNADVRVARGDTVDESLLTTSSVLLHEDLVFVSGKLPAIVVFPFAVTLIETPGNYRIDGKTGQVRNESNHQPLPTNRVDADQPLVIPPAQLLASLPPPSALPHSQAAAHILSPKDATYSQNPDIVWIPTPEKPLEIVLMPLPGDETATEPGAERTVRGQAGRLAWSETGWDPLPRGSNWRLSLRRDDTVIATASFRVLSEPESATIEHRLDAARRLIPEGMARTFSEASILLENRPSCAAEARLLAMRLWQSPRSEDNLIYLKLIERAYNRMAMPQAVEKFQSEILERIERLTAVKEE